MSRSMDIRRVSRQPAPAKPTRQRRKFPLWFTVIILGVLALLGLKQQGYLRSSADSPAPLTTSSPTATPPRKPKPTDSLGPTKSIVPPTPTPSETPAPTPSPSPSATLSQADISIRILNGSGTPGKANVLKSQLETDGFAIRTTGTAKNRRQTSIIYYRSDAKAKAELVASSISNLQVDLFENDSLAAPDDVLVVVGAR